MRFLTFPKDLPFGPCGIEENCEGGDAVVRIRTADHPINSRGLYRTELRRPARPYKRAAQIVSQPRTERQTGRSETR